MPDDQQQATRKRKPYTYRPDVPKGRSGAHDVAPGRDLNPKGPERVNEDADFSDDLRDETPRRIRRGVVSDVTPGDQEKELPDRFPQLSDDELGRLEILDPGTQLPQGAVFLDLNDLKRGPFKAIGGQKANEGEMLIAKSETDYLIWNKIAGQDATADIERPE